jgi:hypothetical protein
MRRTEPFTLRLYFSGICLFTPAQQGRSLDDGIIVLLPGSDDPKKGADGKPLPQHQASLRFRLKNIYGARAVPELTVNWPLKRRRLELRVREAPGACNRLSITRGNSDCSFDFVPNLQKVAPKYGDIDPQDLTASPAANVQAQVLIDKGRVSTHARSDIWTFPPSKITTCEVDQRIAYEVVFELCNIVEATLLLAPLGYYDIEYLRLAPARHEEPLVEVSIVNFEPEGVTKALVDQKTPDVDFKWYFELVKPDEYTNLQKFCTDNNLDLPAPVPPARFSEAATDRRYPLDQATGRDCFPGQSS